MVIVGSFPGKILTGGLLEDDWYYSTGPTRNQFWPIMMHISGEPLHTKAQKMYWCERHGIGFADIIYSCERKGNSNLDSNLINKTYDLDLFNQIFNQKHITQLLFTGKGVLQEFHKHFSPPAHLQTLALPSPSPAYASMSFSEKAEVYKNIFNFQIF